MMAEDRIAVQVSHRGKYTALELLIRVTRYIIIVQPAL